MAIAFLTCGAVQTADAAWHKLTNWWYGKPPLETQTPEKPSFPQTTNQEFFEDFAKETDKKTITTKEQWSTGQKEFIQAANEMFFAIETEIQNLTNALEKKNIHLTSKTNIKNEGFLVFQEKEESKYFNQLFDESRGIGKILETRQFVPNEFTDFKNKFKELKNKISQIIEILYHGANTTNKKGHILLTNSLKKMLSIWQSFMDEVTNICANNGIYFTQGTNEISFISQKAEHLKKIGKESKERLIEFVDENNETLIQLTKSAFNGIDNLIESFTYQWGFFTTMQELQKTISTAYQSTIAAIKKIIKNIEHVDIESQEFENLSKSILELM